MSLVFLKEKRFERVDSFAALDLFLRNARLFFEKNYGLEIISAEQIWDGNELVFLIKTIKNQSFSFKIYRSAFAPDEARLTQISTWLLFLETQKINAPRPIATLDGLLFSSFFFEEKKIRCTLFEWLEGKKITRLTRPTVRSMGVLMAQLHEAAAHFSAKNLNLLRLDSDFVKTTAVSISSELSEHGFSKKEATLFQKKGEKLAAALDSMGYEPLVFGPIHSDLHPANLLRHRQKLVAIDWDDLAFGHFLLDIAVVFAEFEAFPKRKTMLRDAFLEGYEHLRPLPFFDWETDFRAASLVANLLFASWVFAAGNEFVRANQANLKRGKQAALNILNY